MYDYVDNDLGNTAHVKVSPDDHNRPDPSRQQQLADGQAQRLLLNAPTLEHRWELPSSLFSVHCPR